VPPGRPSALAVTLSHTGITAAATDIPALTAPSAPPRFEPGALAAGNPLPDRAAFAPADPKGLARIFGGNSRHACEVAAAQVRFDVAVKAHAQAEAARQRALANAKAAYDLQVAADQKRVADVRARQSAFISGDPEAVEWFVSRVLDASRYPRGFRATGKPARPHLLSVSAERAVFEDLVLAAVEPAACLTQLNALVSPNPYDLRMAASMRSRPASTYFSVAYA
jgi:hypothetical protein